MSTPVVIYMQRPMSVNTLFSNRRGGRHKTDKYKAWREEAAVIIKSQKWKKITGKYAMRMVIKKDGRMKDLSNYIKAPEDALVECGVIEDDSLCQALDVSWGTFPGKHAVMIEITPWKSEKQ